MYVERVPNRNSPPAILLRESYREGGRVRKRTLANLSGWEPAKIEALRRALQGQGDPPLSTSGSLAEGFEIVRSLPHGHVAAVLGVVRKLRLPRLLDRCDSPMRRHALALIVARVLDPDSKLATARALSHETELNTIGPMLGLEGDLDVEVLYHAMDWLFARQDRVEKALAKQHLADGTLVLYDVSSTYFEGQACPLAEYGHSRDGKADKLQIVFGLLCNAQGCPVAVEVFSGNTSDPKTLKAQLEKVHERFGLRHVVLVGDRGMITQARIENDLAMYPDLLWITALRAPSIATLLEADAIQLSLFDTRDLGEITHPDFPDQRLIVCRNPLLADKRVKTREALLVATEKALQKIVAATTRKRKPLRGQDAIGVAVGKVINAKKVGKYFQTTITDTSFSFARNRARIDQDAAQDGLYVIRTNVPKDLFTSDETVGAYKNLAVVERAFRSLKTVDLEVRPIHHHLEHRVRGHVFLCMLAYYVQWHMRTSLRSVLFDDEFPEEGHAKRRSIVAPAQRSDAAEAKAATQRTADGRPVHSFRTLLKDLGTVCLNLVRPTDQSPAFYKMTLPTSDQQHIFDLLGVPLAPPPAVARQVNP